MSKLTRVSVFRVAYQEVQRPVLLILALALAAVLSAVYPTDVDSYATPSARVEVQAKADLIENYLRFVPTVLQVALPLLLGDKVGLVQLAYVGIATTVATHSAKYLLNDCWIRDTRLGRRPNGGRHNMPSGHSSMASCAVYFVGRRYGIKLAILMLPFLLLTMYGRVISLDHTLSAVVAGALLGFLTTAWFTAPLSRRNPAHPRQPVLLEQARQPLADLSALDFRGRFPAVELDFNSASGTPRRRGWRSAFPTPRAYARLQAWLQRGMRW